MKFLSLFDGCHMFGHALRNVGAECVGTSEIETHPANVTRYHYPDTPQLGDVRNVDATRIGFDCLLAGWSCQGNSVAGDRLGLADERSGLFSEVVRIARQGAPRWLLLENVPGMFSVNERKDFGACIGQLGQLGYAVGWRVLDAQHFGVPQRRRRVFFVGCLGDPRSAAEVLFEPESVRGDSAPSREARESATSETWGGAQGVRGNIAHALTAEGADASEDGSGRGTPVVAQCLTTGTGQRYDAETETFVVDVAQVTSKTNRSSAKPHALTPSGPRRLMPIECERLQGLPDDWTRYGRKQNGEVYEIKDSPRYKMIGNGGAVPVVEWIGSRMVEL